MDHRPRPPALALLVVLGASPLAACGGGDDDGGGDGDEDPRDAVGDGAASDGPGADGPPGDGPIAFHCRRDDGCPEVTIAGDPLAEIDGQPNPYRGLGDPSLELDPTTGTLWLAYSWLEAVTSPAGADLAVETHLARSDDDGATFTFVRAVNEAALAPSWDDPGTTGWRFHEVPSLVRGAAGDWGLTWLRYFEPAGEPPPERDQLHLVYSAAASPAALGDDAVAWVRGFGTSDAVGAMLDLSTLVPELADCAVFTEPALVTDDGATYLAVSCLSVVGGTRRVDLDRLVLLEAVPGGLAYRGTLLDADDAAAEDADRLEQADLAVARDGSMLLLVTPIVDDGDPQHHGCVAYTADLSTASVRRDDGGRAVARARLTGDGNGLGPGLCTYDAASETGVLFVIPTFDVDGTIPDILFTLHATGVHP